MGRIKHNLSTTPEYYIWKCMRQRCNNPKSHKYPIYGGRGITVCERWNDFHNFISDMGTRPNKDYSIDRINNDGNYEPQNCRWSTRSEQMRNRREYSQEVKDRIVKNLGNRNLGIIYSDEKKDEISDTICRNKWGEEKYNSIKNLIIGGESLSKISKRFNVHYRSINKLKNRLQLNGED